VKNLVAEYNNNITIVPVGASEKIGTSHLQAVAVVIYLSGALRAAVSGLARQWLYGSCGSCNR